MTNTTDIENRAAWLAFTRIFSAVGAAALAESLKGHGVLAELAQDYAAFELRRYERACWALQSLRDCLADDDAVGCMAQAA
jgi:hypothetical protein